ncbi:Ig-like domain-containing protein [Rubritalea tangerina]|uniref:Ig-like domain-containing protein n=1 Tax=Rubritalea tangerina TaxID=430798 RepID=UPI003613C258
MKSLALTTLVFAPILCAQPTLKVSTSQLAPESEFTITFDQAVVPETQLNELTNNTILKIKPKWEGQIQWQARNIATFYPSVPPKLGTKYTFNISDTLTYQDGTKVPNFKTRTIEAPAFGSTYHRRYNKGNNRKPISYFRFNDAVNPTKLDKKFYYISKEGAQSQQLLDKRSGPTSKAHIISNPHGMNASQFNSSDALVRPSPLKLNGRRMHLFLTASSPLPNTHFQSALTGSSS